MSIAFTKYVDITSFTVNNPLVTTRDYITRIFTTNPLIPTNSFAEFTSLSQVGDYFGTTSEEYDRAAFYFGFISKTYYKPQKLSFASYVPVAVPPKIFGSRFSTTLTQFQAISTGSFRMTLGAVTNDITGLDFSTATSLADVAAEIELAINAETGVQWTAATVTYDAARGAFNFVGGDAVNAVISVTSAGVGTDIVNAIGWGSSAIFSDGSIAVSVTDTLQNSADASNNFATFLFMPATELAIDEITEAAAWNAAYTPNISFMYLVPVLRDDASDYSIALNGYAGTVVSEYTSISGYVEMLPGAILAATRYDLQNSVQNYMFQQSVLLSPTVTTTSDSDTLDNLGINYYGQTQAAGQQISFYQRGTVYGTDTDPQFINIYANEIWLKDAMAVAILNAFLLLQQIPANTEGLQTIKSIQQPVIEQALVNKVISVGKQFTQAQKAEITAISGDAFAWLQVQNFGYWYSSRIDTYMVASTINYKVIYVLIYGKDDTINKIEGEHFLI